MTDEAGAIWDAPIGIAGGGVMGASLAADLACKGRTVVVCETSEVARQRFAEVVEHEMRTIALIRARGSDLAEDLRRVSITAELSALAPCRLVVENITESAKLKKQFYAALRTTLRDDTVLLFNSSTFRVRDVAEWFGRYDRLAGVHFMNPVGLIDSVEMVTSEFTPRSTTSLAVELLALMGKRAMQVADAPGYVSNRVYMVTVNEAVRCLQEGIADASTIDEIFRSCFGWKAGPIATADLIGLDTIKLSLEALHAAFGEEKYKPAELLSEMTRAGRIGRKAGVGFYDYE